MKKPLITMSAITGKPQRPQIYEYLKGLKENGIEQAMLYPRSGCEIEYLSEEWFDTVGHFLSSAKELDMCLWLYDDFNWPSGDAGGRVTAKEAFRLKAIKVKGENKGEITSKSRHNSGLFGEKYFPNLLSYQAVDYFIEYTHREYYKRFSEYFGTVIKGMFTDEPSVGYCCEGDFLPYYEGIKEDYFNLCSRDFYADIENEHPELYLSVITLVSQRFNKCYVTKLAQWCRDHGILMTGHFMCDDDPPGATKHAGRFLENLKSFSLPGIDEIYTDPTGYGEMVLLGSVQYARGENGAMAELFALGPCDMSYAKRKCMLYLTAAFGVDHYFLAISHLDMRGNMYVKDYFSNFSPDQPDFGGMRLLSQEAEKAASLAGKDFVADLYIRYPFKQSIDAIKNGKGAGNFALTLNRLTDRGIQWKFIDDEVVNAPVIEVDGDFNCTLNGKAVDVGNLCGSVSILDAKGNCATGIFVRKYNDGTMLIINRLPTGGEYIIDGKRIFLDGYAVRTESAEEKHQRQELLCQFDVTYPNDNIIRPMYINSQPIAEVVCQSDMAVRLCVRNGEELTLDGEKIKCENKAPLPKGMQALYSASDTVVLEKGKHSLSTTNDIKYMPSAFLCGSFACTNTCGEICTLTLQNRQEKYQAGEHLFGYGTVELTTSITVPKGAVALELCGADMYTCVYANGEPLGEQIVAPFTFPIDQKLWGKEVTLKIVQHSTLSPIFGNTKHWDEKTISVPWRGTPSTSNPPFGFDNLFWIV